MEKTKVQTVIDMLTDNVKVEETASTIIESIQNQDEEVILTKEDLLGEDQVNPPIIKNIDQIEQEDI
jgi:hypothetical protein